MSVDDSSCVDEYVCASDCLGSKQSFHLESTNNSINGTDNTETDFYFDKVKTKIVYDDTSIFSFSNDTATTVAATYSDASVGNASIASEECFQGEVDQPQFNYRGPKVVPSRHETPVSILTANTIGTLRSRRIFRVLFDSGSNISLMKRSCLPKNCQTKPLESSRKVSTLAGKLQVKEVVTMRDIRLPEFDKNRRIDSHKCLVHDNDACNYDIILGTQFLSKTGIKLDNANNRWNGLIQPFL
jgi:hypothetical protein